MTLFEILPIVALFAAAAFILSTVTGPRATPEHAWILPGLLSAVFLAFTLVTILQEGLLGVWPEHTIGYWTNQIWFDLLINVSIAWVLLLPRMKAHGMQIVPWMLFIMITAGIGTLAALSRVLYLNARQTAVPVAA